MNVTKSGDYVINKMTLSETELAAALDMAATKNPGSKVQVRADEDTAFKFPLTVVGLCKRNNLRYSCTVLSKDQ